MDPDRAVAYAYRSIIKVQNADPEGALQDFDKALELKPKPVEERKRSRWASISRHRLPQVDSAIEAINQMVQVSPDYNLQEVFAGAYLARGISLFQKGNFDEAIRDLERAASLRPGIDIGNEYVACFFGRGMKKFQTGDTDGAIEDYTKALELQPADIHYTRRAQAYYKQKKYTEAEKDFTTAMEINLSNAENYYGRGITHYVRMNYGNALEDFKKAIILDQRLAETCKSYIDDIKAKLA